MSVSSTRNLLKSNKKVEYYGVHEDDMMKQSFKDILKMRKFVEENSATTDASKD